MTDELTRSLRTLGGFDADVWAGRLTTAQEQVATALAEWEEKKAHLYSEEGRAQHRERMRQPEQAARERAMTEAEAALRHVVEAKAELELHTGLSAAEQREVDQRLQSINEQSKLLTPEALARKIQAAVTLGDKVACALWSRAAEQRLHQARDEASDDNPVVAYRARTTADALRPALEAANALLESSTAAELRKEIARVERSAQRLKAQALLASPATIRAEKRASGAYSL